MNNAEDNGEPQIINADNIEAELTDIITLKNNKGTTKYPSNTCINVASIDSNGNIVNVPLYLKYALEPFNPSTLDFTEDTKEFLGMDTEQCLATIRLVDENGNRVMAMQITPAENCILHNIDTAGIRLSSAKEVIELAKKVKNIQCNQNDLT